MKFVELTIKKGFLERHVDFSEKANLIFSQNNSVGKTTLLRAALYAMGYPVPNTRGLKFEQMEFWLTVENQNQQFILYRRQAAITVNNGKRKQIFTLPTDFYDVLAILTGTDNLDILSNLLGTFYLDQEKGWTLLNRGKVIGSIPFNIDSLVRGLSGVDCSNDLETLEATRHELQKYKYMLSVSDYQKALIAEGQELDYDTPDEETKIQIELCKAEKFPIEKECKQIIGILRQNEAFGKFISNMNLRVKSQTGEEIPVTEQTLVGYEDNSAYLTARREMLEAELGRINKKLYGYERQQKKQTSLFNLQNAIQEFDSNIKNIKVDPIATQGMIDRLKSEKKALEEKIRFLTRQDDQLISELHYIINRYATELGVDGKYVPANHDYIFTNDLKSLSGAILHKLVFSFRLAYVRVIQERVNLVLPIILDSPSGSEVQHEAVEDMLKIVQRDFQNHQLIVASIYDFHMSDENVIKLHEKLLEPS